MHSSIEATLPSNKKRSLIRYPDMKICEDERRDAKRHVEKEVIVAMIHITYFADHDGTTPTLLDVFKCVREYSNVPSIAVSESETKSEGKHAPPLNYKLSLRTSYNLRFGICSCYSFHCLIQTKSVHTFEFESHSMYAD